MSVGQGSSSEFWLSHVNLFTSVSSISMVSGSVLTANNLGDPNLDTITRFSGTTSVTFRHNLGTPQQVDLVAVLGTNLVLSHSVTVTYRNSALTSLFSQTIHSSVHDEGYAAVLTPADDLPSHHFSMPSSTLTTVQYIDVTLTGNVSEVNTFDVGALWIGKVWRPVEGVNWSTKETWDDDSIVDFTRGHQAYVNEREAYRRVDLNFTLLTETETYGTVSGGVITPALMPIWFRNGTKRRVIAGLQNVPAAPSLAECYLIHRQTIYGLMQGNLSPVPVDAVNGQHTYRTGITIRETR